MSTLDIVLAQKQILIALMLAVVPFAVAIMLNLFAWVKRSNTARIARQHQAAIARQAAMRKLADVETRRELAQPDVANVPVERASAPPGPVTPAPTSPAAKPPVSGDAPEPEAAVDAEAAVEAQAADDNDEAPSSDDTVSSAMQALLSDVFGDDETTVQYENLLRGFDDVSTHDLIALGQKLMENMQQHQSPPASE